MITRPYREHHLLALLEGYEAQQLPLDLYISHYFRSHKALGSKDRGMIAENVYALVRWRGLLDHLCGSPTTWEERFTFFHSAAFEEAKHDESVPAHIRLSFPQVLFNLMVQSLGLEQAQELCRISNRPAPTTVRVNSMKTTREAMMEKWKGLYDVSECLHSPYGIIFHKKINFFSLPEFQAGLFEVQDEGSQLLASLMKVSPGQHVMDYCAGSGGKTLAFAPAMQNTGQIFLHDIRPRVLEDSKKRLRRAGIQNAQVALAGDPKLPKLKKKMDWVLVDAPCSGTGTMRRNPDMKWSFTEETLPRLIGQQRTIFERALSFMKPGGRIVYATCSILTEENESQLAHFTKTYSLKVEGEPFKTTPSDGGMDGFFGAVLKIEG